LGFFEKIKRRRQASLRKGELDSLSSQIESRERKEQEVNAELKRLKVTGKEQNTAVQNWLLEIATTEKLILQNHELLNAHNAEVKKVRASVKEATVRYKIAKDKVLNLREQIVEKQKEIDGSSKALARLQQTLAMSQTTFVD